MLKIIGYGDKLSIAPGETIRFMVSAYDGQPYRARIVRLIHGDANPEGPGFKCEPVASGIEAAHVGRPQAIRCGSWAKVPRRARLRELKSFTVAAMIMPTTPGKGRQGLVGHWDEGGLAGWLLEIDGQGCLAARVGDGRAAVEVGTGAPLHRGHWYLAAMTYDAGTGSLAVVQRPIARLGMVSDAGAGTQMAPGFRAPETDIVMAAVWEGGGVGHHYNGRIDSPRLLDRALPAERLEALFLRPLPSDLAGSVLAAWDFGRDVETVRIVDASPNGLDGEIVNLPTRAVRGWNWDGSEHCWWRRPEQYGAIHFHDDDIYDAGWQADFHWTLPDTLRSGVYAAHVWSGEAEDGTEEDYIPFFVRPPRGRLGRDGRPRLAFLAPTASYIAYANDQNHIDGHTAEMVIGRLLAYQPSDVFLHDHPELGKSLYDVHSDGSGVAYSLAPAADLEPAAALQLLAGRVGLGIVAVQCRHAPARLARDAHAGAVRRDHGRGPARRRARPAAALWLHRDRHPPRVPFACGCGMP